MEADGIELNKPGECSNELKIIIDGIVSYIEKNGVSNDPTDAPAYWLLDRLTTADQIVKEFVSSWPDYDVSEAPNGGIHQMYYLPKLHREYGEQPISEVVREIGLIDQFRQSQMRSGVFQIDDGSRLHGLVFRGILAVAPETDVTRAAIQNVIRRYESGRNSVDERIMSESALGLLEHDYDKYQEIVDSVTNRVAEDLSKCVESSEGEYIQSSDLLLLAKNPTYTSSNIHSASSLLFAGRMREGSGIYELGYSSEVGIALLAAGHGPTKSSFHADWQAELQQQRQQNRLPKFVSTQPATAVDNRRTDIKQRIEYMIEDTEKSLYIATRGIGMLHHELLDLLEEKSDFDFRILTNRKRAGGDRKKFKRAAMNELAERTGTGVKQSELLHARMVISDEERLLVSNADFTRDQLHDSFNAGIYTEHQNAVKPAVEMFIEAWESGEYFDPS